jgi:hypothetical protein
MYPDRPSGFSHRRAYTSSSPAKQTAKKRDPFASALLLALHRHGLNGLDRKGIVWRKQRYRDPMGGQKTPQPRILFPQSLVFPIRALE